MHYGWIVRSKLFKCINFAAFSCFIMYSENLIVKLPSNKETANNNLLKPLFIDPTCIHKLNEFDSFCESCFKQSCNHSYTKLDEKMNDSKIFDDTETCDAMFGNYCFPRRSMTQYEAQFPLAFIILAYKEPDRFFKLFQSIYWPQNQYCINIDVKAHPQMHEMANRLANCFPHQVIVLDPSVNVTWAGPGIVNATFQCMKALHSKSQHNWQYVTLLTGREFPLRTNYEMVKVLNKFGGYSDASVQPKVFWNQPFFKLRVPEDIREKLPLSKIHKGSAGLIFARKLVGEVLESSILESILDWMSRVQYPDEFLPPSIVYASEFTKTIPHSFLKDLAEKQYNILDDFRKENISIPNSLDVVHDYYSFLPHVLLYHEWDYSKCNGVHTWDHGCEFSMRDMPRVINRPEFIVHKFVKDYSPMAYDCLRRWFLARNWALQDVTNIGWQFDHRFYDIAPAALFNKWNNKKFQLKDSVY